MLWNQRTQFILTVLFALLILLLWGTAVARSQLNGVDAIQLWQQDIAILMLLLGQQS